MLNNPCRRDARAPCLAARRWISDRLSVIRFVLLKPADDRGVIEALERELVLVADHGHPGLLQ